ncbi:MAG: hypothetical protein ABID54_10195 [Pseudomonadota bacterium]
MPIPKSTEPIPETVRPRPPADAAPAPAELPRRAPAQPAAPAPFEPPRHAPAQPPPAASGEPAAPVPGPLAAVDRILERMELGNIAFNTPKSMNLNNTAVIQLLLGVETPIEELKRLVEAEGEKVGEKIRISNRMEARLSGPNFAITAITPETQAVSRTEVTEWKWEIKPRITGRHFLHLTLSAILSVESAATPRTIRTFDKVIEVEITWNQKVTGFIGKNWQWLWATIVAPIAGWLWKRRRSRAKQK